MMELIIGNVLLLFNVFSMAGLALPVSRLLRGKSPLGIWNDESPSSQTNPAPESAISTIDID